MSNSTMQTALRLIMLAPVELNNAVSQLPIADAQDVERDLEQIAVQAAAVAGYTGKRKGTIGDGVHSHSDAVKEFNKRRRNVRKALGFSYPERGEFTF